MKRKTTHGTPERLDMQRHRRPPAQHVHRARRAQRHAHALRQTVRAAHCRPQQTSSMISPHCTKNDEKRKRDGGGRRTVDGHAPRRSADLGLQERADVRPPARHADEGQRQESDLRTRFLFLSPGYGASGGRVTFARGVVRGRGGVGVRPFLGVRVGDRGGGRGARGGGGDVQLDAHGEAGGQGRGGERGGEDVLDPCCVFYRYEGGEEEGYV
jgi:hypothetical protein